MNTFQVGEKHLSQGPAVQLLVAMGYEYISPSEALRERQGKLSNVLLEGILRNQLKKINSISYKENEYLFSEANIQGTIEELKNMRYVGLLQTNMAVYDCITSGATVRQNIEGDNKSFTAHYIDWDRPERNCFHVTVEYSVERSRSRETVRPDIVLFVNGIPFCVIECKSPQTELGQAVSQSIRNQNDAYIPKLFTYTQLLLALNKTSASYATTGTKENFWTVWKEKFSHNLSSLIAKLVNTPLPDTVADAICHTLRIKKEVLSHRRSTTEQDKALFSLCRPERLLELARTFTVFDGSIRKIARYQQYFVIKSTVERIKHFNKEESREGGVIWHTQGSGKSLTMVMLVLNMARDPEISDPRFVIVTDRNNLDKQLGHTFTACGLSIKRATSGRNLLALVAEQRASIITTLIHKFDSAYAVKKYQDNSSNIFVLVDEGHRSQFGQFFAYMKLMFPRACFIGFTGTPLMKKKKNSFAQFGPLIKPHYSVNQAVEDGAVVPLYYELRHAEMCQNKKAIDLWFERHTVGLTSTQKTDLKRKYARAESLNKANRVIYMRAYDMSTHYQCNWKGTGFKAQLVTPDKRSALKYKEYLDNIGIVSSEVVISPPDMREGYGEVDDSPHNEVLRFWQKMMKRHGNEEAYTRYIIDQFKHEDEPEILIVVDKLLTGFDAPRNTVMYLCSALKEHRLLQAIARVNRVCKGKEHGVIIDYVNTLGELDKALTMYKALENFNEEDIAGTIVSINEEIEKLSECHTNLWKMFEGLENPHDEESYEVLLADDTLREEFYSRLSLFSKTLSTALSSEKFLSTVEDKTLSQYKNGLRKFHALKASVGHRYADSINYRDYEPKIKKLLNTHIQSDEVVQLTEPVNIFNDTMFDQVKENAGVYKFGKSTASQGDTIIHATKKALAERMNKDPASYEKFSKMIQQAIDDFKAGRLSEKEYLDASIDIRNRVAGNIHDDIPDMLAGENDAIAYYGVIEPVFKACGLSKEARATASSHTAIAIQGILAENKKIHFWEDEDAQKQAFNKIDDYFYDDLRTKHSIELSPDQMDAIIDRVMRIAKYRR